jgi:hypothetical protein
VQCGTGRADVFFAWELRHEIYHSWQIPLCFVFPCLGYAGTLYFFLKPHAENAGSGLVSVIQ